MNPFKLLFSLLNKPKPKKGLASANLDNTMPECVRGAKVGGSKVQLLGKVTK